MPIHPLIFVAIVLALTVSNAASISSSLFFLLVHQFVAERHLQFSDLIALNAKLLLPVFRIGTRTVLMYDFPSTFVL
jgi:hypothetical protein